MLSVHQTKYLPEQGAVGLQCEKLMLKLNINDLFQAQLWQETITISKVTLTVIRRQNII